MAAPVHVSISPDVIAHIGSFPITNTLLTSWIVIAVLTLLSWLFTRNLSYVPGKLQALGETIIESLLNFFTMVSGSRDTAERHFPIVATIFLYVLMSNWLGIFPGVGTIGFWHEAHHADAEEHTIEQSNKHSSPETLLLHNNTSTTSSTSSVQINVPTTSTSSLGVVGSIDKNNEKNSDQVNSDHDEAPAQILTPILRSVNSDLNMTLALAMFVVVVSHIIGISRLGAGQHIGKYLNFSNPINFFVGILELIGEFSRMISFSFRLFGNIFAGEVLLVIISFLVPYLVPLPFLGLELFVGIVQATIFATLAIIFIGQAETAHH